MLKGILKNKINIILNKLRGKKHLRDNLFYEEGCCNIFLD